MMKKYFVKQGIKEVSIEDFIRQNFPSADYSRIELQRTPLGIKIVIYTHKPGRVIGRSGSKINRMSETLKAKFDLDNPQIDVKSVDNPNLDSRIVAKQIKSALERGYNYKKIGNVSLKKIMDAGAVGTEITISGKLGGSKSRMAKFSSGYLKHCGDTAQKLVDYGFEEALNKPGKIGIKVKIMKEFMDITGHIVRKADKREERAPDEREFRDEAAFGVGSVDFNYADKVVVEEAVSEEAEKKPAEIPEEKPTESPEEKPAKKTLKKEKTKK